MTSGTFGPSLAAMLVFCTMIGGVPLAQAVREWRTKSPQSALVIFQRPPLPKYLRAYEKQLEEKSWLVKAVRPRTQELEFRWLQLAGVKAVIGRDGWYFYKPGLNYPTRRARPGESTSQDALAAIVDFRDQLASRGIRLIVMPAPNKESIYPDRLTVRAAGMELAKSPETAALLNALKAADVEVVDLFELFGAAKSAGSEPLYLAQDSHWSPAGLRLAAQAVVERIRKGAAPAPGTTPYSSVEVPLKRHGDVLQMLQSPLIEQAIAPEQVNCSQVVQESDRALYKDRMGAEVLILGDSFLRIFEEDEPESSGFIAQLAKELSQPMMSLVGDGGASTLVRQELNRRGKLLTGKKIVIWEFVERDIRYGAEGWQKIPLPEPIQKQ